MGEKSRPHSENATRICAMHIDSMKDNHTTSSIWLAHITSVREQTCHDKLSRFELVHSLAKFVSCLCDAFQIIIETYARFLTFWAKQDKKLSFFTGQVGQLLMWTHQVVSTVEFSGLDVSPDLFLRGSVYQINCGCTRTSVQTPPVINWKVDVPPWKPWNQHTRIMHKVFEFSWNSSACQTIIRN